MDKIVKINSVTAPPFTANQNLVRFRFGGGDVYNLRDSYMNLNVTFDVEGTAGAVYIPDLEWISTDNKKPLAQNISFVRNAFMNTARKGMVESLSRVDLMKTNLHNYTKSQRELYSEGYLRCSALQNPINGGQSSIYRQINKLGTEALGQGSRVVNSVPIQIRLGDIFDFANTPELDTSKCGDVTVECELNIDKFGVQQRYSGDPANQTPGNDEPDPGAPGSTPTTIVLTNKINDLTALPFYVSQQVKINATSAGGAPAVTDVSRRITGISRDNATNEVTLTFDSNWATLASGQSYNTITVEPEAWTSATVEYDSAEVVLKTVANPKGLDSIFYHTFSTEEYTTTPQVNFQHQFQCEPESDSVFIVFPNTANGLISTPDNALADYRLRLNNENLTSEKVAIRSPLYYDRTDMMIDGMGHELRNLVENCGCTRNQGGGAQAWSEVYSRPELAITTAGNPLWSSDRTKLLQVNITGSGAGVGALTLFKSLPRVFEY
jgi:hypothetical protein